MDSMHDSQPIIQQPAHGSECLKSLRDVRSTQEERLAIKEGSLVISIPPSFVDISRQLIAPDEFELRLGELFVVCRIFADMWALCARVKNSHCVADAAEDDLYDSPNIKFLPLCAVTLASNFASFARRCAIYRMEHTDRDLFPSGWNCISPPERVESLEASRKYFYSAIHNQIPLHPMVYVVCRTPNSLPDGTDYEPLQDEQTEQPRQSQIQSERGIVNNNTAEAASTPSIVPVKSLPTTPQRSLRRFWRRQTVKSSESSTVGDQPAETSQRNNAGLTPSGKSSYARYARLDLSSEQDSQDADGTAQGGEGSSISKRRGVRGFFSRSGRAKNSSGIQV